MDKKYNEWLDITEASKYIRLSKSAIYKRTMMGTIQFYKIGKKLLFRRSDLDQYILNGASSPEDNYQGVRVEK